MNPTCLPAILAARNRQGQAQRLLGGGLGNLAPVGEILLSFQGPVAETESA